ncbi:MAG: cytochrome C554 [candidate division Zixibacteria bacterium]|nr:cytochrome C554 [candidate division Zixibacteria bacterium]
MLNKRSIVFILFVLVLFTYVLALAEVDHQYVGASKCKLCHKMEKYGDQWSVWESSLHAKAFETLATEKAKENAKKHGIDDPQKSEKCLKCHVTAYEAPSEAKADSYTMEDGVQCEECHGPGSDYKSMKVMKDREASLAAGLVIPDEQTCLQCHIPEGNDFFVEFDYETFWEKIKHTRPPEE